MISRLSDCEKFLIYGDVHSPYTDEKCWNVLCEFARYFKPDVVVENGDGWDAYQCSRFDKDPNRQVQMDSDRSIFVSERQQLISVLPKNCLKVYLEGNHENHLARELTSKVPHIATLPEMQFGNFLHLGELGFQVASKNTIIPIGELNVIHCLQDQVSTESAYTAKNSRQKLGCNVLINHTHRLGSSFHNTRRGQTVGYENGCLCRLDMPYIIHPNWQQGFSYGYVLRNGLFAVYQVPILEGKALIDGLEFRG